MEKEYQAQDVVLDSFTNSTTPAMQLIHLSEDSAREEAVKLHSATLKIEAFFAASFERRRRICSTHNFAESIAGIKW